MGTLCLSIHLTYNLTASQKHRKRKNFHLAQQARHLSLAETATGCVGFVSLKFPSLHLLSANLIKINPNANLIYYFLHRISFDMLGH